MLFLSHIDPYFSVFPLSQTISEMQLARLHATKFDGPLRHASRASNMYVLHGLMGSGTSWRTLAGKMQHHGVLNEKLTSIHCVDLRNHGESQHVDAHTNALMCSDVERYIVDDMKKKSSERDVAASKGKSVIVAHSMGGAVAMASLIRQANRKKWIADGYNGYANPLPGDDQNIMGTLDLVPDGHEMLNAHLPGSIGGAIIVDINPFANRPPAIDKIEHDLKLLLDLDLTTVRSLTDAHNQLSKRGLVDSNMRNFLLTNLNFRRMEGQEPKAYWRANLETIVKDLDFFLFNLKPEWATVPCDIPIVFVYGKNSPYNALEYRQDVPKFFSNVVDVIEIADAGHFVHYEKMSEFIDKVAPHINRFFE